MMCLKGKQSKETGKMNTIQHIQETFKEHQLSVDAIYEIDENEILVCISWGDWKHEHLRCDNIMKGLGYAKIQEVITEDSGDDAYSSEHTYIKV